MKHQQLNQHRQSEQLQHGAPGGNTDRPDGIGQNGQNAGAITWIFFVVVAVIAITAMVMEQGRQERTPAALQRFEMQMQQQESGYDSEIEIWADRPTTLRVYDPALVDGDGVVVAGADVILQGPDQPALFTVQPGTTAIQVTGSRLGTLGPITVRIESDAGTVTSAAMQLGETITIPVIAIR